MHAAFCRFARRRDCGRSSPAACANERNPNRYGMLLALNVNNTNTVIALFPMEDGGTSAICASTWRISTRHAQTADEYGILVRNLLQGEGVESSDDHRHRYRVRRAADGLDSAVILRALLQPEAGVYRARREDGAADPYR